MRKRAPGAPKCAVNCSGKMGNYSHRSFFANRTLPANSDPIAADFISFFITTRAACEITRIQSEEMLVGDESRAKKRLLGKKFKCGNCTGVVASPKTGNCYGKCRSERFEEESNSARSV